jgi:hypothetical protein
MVIVIQSVIPSSLKMLNGTVERKEHGAKRKDREFFYMFFSSSLHFPLDTRHSTLFSLDHLFRPHHYQWWNRQAKGLGGL